MIAITGDIASGKSTVSRHLCGLGFSLYSADSITHELYLQEKVLIDIRNLFNLEFVDRKSIREIVFNDEQKLKMLNDYLHPLIIEKIQTIIRSFDSPTVECMDTESSFVFFEIPLLFECNVENLFDYSILVTADFDVKVNRIITRDSCSIEQAKFIINKQMPQSEKICRADFVIENNQDVDTLISNIDILLQNTTFIPISQRHGRFTDEVRHTGAQA